MAQWLRRLIYLLRQSRHDAELREEIEAHRALRQAHLEREGLAVTDADAASRRAIGSVSVAREESREVWLGSWATWPQDARHGLRVWRRSPGLAALVVLTMATGIGMNAAMFGVFRAVLLRPLDYPDAERLAFLTHHSDRFNLDTLASRADVAIWRSRAHAFERMVAYGDLDVAMGAQGETSEERLVSATDDFWTVTGARPAIGRLFARGEQDAVVLSHRMFGRRFNGDPAAVGKTITLNGSAVAIVGVLERDFRFALPTTTNEVKEPGLYLLLPDAPTLPGRHDVAPPGRPPVPPWVRVVARLGPGVSLDRARGELQGIYDQIARDYPTPLREGRRLRVMPLQQKIVGGVEAALTILLVAVAFVLLIATTNVAHLLLGRALSRQTEIAVRLALGAGRRRVVVQLVSESLALAAVGCGAGLLLAHGILAVLVRVGPQVIPRLEGAAIDPWVLAFALVAALMSAIAFGAAPGLSLARADVTATLKRHDTAASPARGVTRVRSVLVSLELALAAALLVGAGLMIKSVWLMNARPPGLDPEKTLVARVTLSGPRYASREPQQHYVQELLRRLESLPGVTAVGIDAGSFNFPLAIDGRAGQDPSTGRDAFATFKPVSLGFLRAMGAPLVRGSWPAEAAMSSDAVESTGAMLVNQRFVDVVMRGRDPVGRHVRGPYVSGTVAGVVADFKDWQLDAEPLPQIYVPFSRALVLRSLRIVLRITGDAAAAAPAVRATIARIDPSQAVADLVTLDDLLSASIASRRFTLGLLCLFAAVAMFLALTGAYGVVAHSVAQRAREIGIRMALGATRADVIGLVVRGEMRVVGLGLLPGLLGAFVLAPLMGGVLYGVAARDAVTFVAVGVALTVAALLTSWTAAARSARVDPIVVIQGR
jgi:predicted permease